MVVNFIQKFRAILRHLILEEHDYRFQKLAKAHEAKLPRARGMKHIEPFCQHHETCHCVVTSMHMKVHHNDALLVLQQLVHSM